jgi:hypothetical protein
MERTLGVLVGCNDLQRVLLELLLCGIENGRTASLLILKRLNSMARSHWRWHLLEWSLMIPLPLFLVLNLHRYDTRIAVHHFLLDAIVDVWRHDRPFPSCWDPKVPALDLLLLASDYPAQPLVIFAVESTRTARIDRRIDREETVLGEGDSDWFGSLLKFADDVAVGSVVPDS